MWSFWPNDIEITFYVYICSPWTFSYHWLHFCLLTHSHPNFFPLSSPPFLSSSSFFSVAEAEPGSEWTTCGPLSHTLSPSLTHYIQLGDRPNRGRVDECGEIIRLWIIHPAQSQSTSTLLLFSHCPDLLPFCGNSVSTVPLVFNLTFLSHFHTSP